MSNCQTYDMDGTTVHINYGPAMRKVKRDNLGERWCFKCRKRREFWFIVTAPVEPSYYGPNVDVRCGHCNTSDGDMFPGGYREWE